MADEVKMDGASVEAPAVAPVAAVADGKAPDGPGDLGDILDKYSPSSAAAPSVVPASAPAPVQADGKSEAKPAAAPVAPLVPGATEEDLKDLPDFKGNNDVRERFIVERIQARKAMEKIKAEGKPADPSPGKEATVEDDAKVFELRATAQRVLDGVSVDGWDEAKAQKVLRLAGDVIGGMANEGRALEILERAKEGKFGELSEAVAQEIERALPTLTARSRVAEKEAATREAEQAALKAEANAAFERVANKYPALKEITAGKESREVKFVQDWMRENVGSADKPGRRFAEILNPKNIEGMIDDAMTAFRVKELEVAAVERDRLRRERESLEKPLTGGGPSAGGGGDPKPGSSEALAAIFASRGSR